MSGKIRKISVTAGIVVPLIIAAFAFNYLSSQKAPPKKNCRQKQDGQNKDQRDQIKLVSLALIQPVPLNGNGARVVGQPGKTKGQRKQQQDKYGDAKH